KSYRGLRRSFMFVVVAKLTGLIGGNSKNHSNRVWVTPHRSKEMANGRPRQDLGAAVHVGGRRLGYVAFSGSSWTSVPEMYWYTSKTVETQTTAMREMANGTSDLLFRTCVL